MPIEINSSRFTSKALEVLGWAKGYARRGSAQFIESDDVFRALLSIRLTVAFSILEALHLVDQLRTSQGLTDCTAEALDCDVIESDLSSTMRVIMDLVEREAHASGRSKIDTGHLLTVLANYAPAVTAAIKRASSDERTIQTIIRLANDIAPRHKELADTDDLQIPASLAAQQMVVLPPKPRREDPAPPLVTVAQFKGLLLDLAHSNPRGLGPTERDLLVVALEAQAPQALAFNQGQLTCVLRLLGLDDAVRYAGLIRRLAEPCVSVQTIQEHYNSILDTAEDGPLSEARIIGTLLQVLNGGEPVRKMGPPIDYLNAGDGGVSQGTTSTPLSMHGM
jgi:hypothetical protein